MKAMVFVMPSAGARGTLQRKILIELRMADAVQPPAGAGQGLPRESRLSERKPRKPDCQRWHSRMGGRELPPSCYLGSP